jgi:uncharacterized protein YrrD
MEYRANIRVEQVTENGRNFRVTMVPTNDGNTMGIIEEVLDEGTQVFAVKHGKGTGWEAGGFLAIAFADLEMDAWIAKNYGNLEAYEAK